MKADLIAIVGEDGFQDSDALARRDPGLDPGNLDAGAAVFPRSATEVQQIIQLCARNAVSIVPQGGLTGLAGGARSAAGQLIVSTDAMTGPILIDVLGRTALTGAGVTLDALNTAAAPHGLCAPVDIGSRAVTTIGGMIATNAGGSEAFRNGVMRQQVLGLEAVAGDGTILSDLKRVTKSNEGIDVKQLFIGSEGTLGIITKAVLRLQPVRTATCTLLMAFDGASDALQTLDALMALPGCSLLKAEMMTRDYAYEVADILGLNALIRFADRPLYIIFDLASDGDDPLERVMDIIGDQADAIVAQNEREAANIWRLREDGSGLDQRYPHGQWFDVSVPLASLDRYLADVHTAIAAIDPSIRVFVLGHLGDGNVHFTITNGAPLDDSKAAITNVINQGAMVDGGSFSAEHGIGAEKRAAMATLGDPGKRVMMQAVKAAIDPHGIMNPGKVL